MEPSSKTVKVVALLVLIKHRGTLNLTLCAPIHTMPPDSSIVSGGITSNGIGIRIGDTIPQLNSYSLAVVVVVVDARLVEKKLLLNWTWGSPLCYANETLAGLYGD